ncbi:MAG: hypothetical protein H0X53_07995 [Sphingomonas sp.]|nr:hypothetical protein [Sphingomonas sp.]
MRHSPVEISASTAPATAFDQADLGELLLASFRTACSQQRLEVAESVLVALEELAEQDFREGKTEGSHRLVEAYAVVAE